jgi:hypothetical protein
VLRGRLLRVRVALLDRDRVVLPALLVLTAVLGVLVTVVEDWVPLASLMVPLLVGAALLSRRSYLVLVTAVLLVAVAVLIVSGPLPRRVVTAAILAGTGAVMLTIVGRRERLGVPTALGADMLMDLRERLNSQADLSVLSAPWHLEAEFQSAGGASFRGDFLVTALLDGGRRAELALVDVSGKGVAAGVRALQLSGAYGGLLGAVPPAQFLDAANTYLYRQSWGEGFATAVHLALDIESGHFQARTAGHPPPVCYHASTGTWRVLGTRGALLGPIPTSSREAVTGRLAQGDAILLCTDGLVESATRDLDTGLDKLMGLAESQVLGGFAGAAGRIVAAMGAGTAASDDDRALIVLWRE